MSWTSVRDLRASTSALEHGHKLPIGNTRSDMKKLLNPSYACMLIAVAVVAYGFRAPSDGPSVRIENASGEVQLQNSRDGTAIFQTGNLAPGKQVSGTVQLTNTGSGAGALDLSQLDLVDTPGSGLGILSTALQLSVQDITDPGAPVTVFSGAPSALGNRPLGSLAPGQSRTYSFTASLPGATGNAHTGSAMSARYVWTLTGDSGDGGGGSGDGGSSGADGSSGSIAGGSFTGGGGPSTMPVTVKVNVKKAAKTGVVAVSVGCGEPCRLNAYAAAKGKPAVRTSRRSGQVSAAGKSATIKLQLSKKATHALRKRLKKGSVVLTVTVMAQDPRGAWKTVTKKVKGKRSSR